MKQIYWLSIGALVMAVVAGILFLVLSLGTLSGLKEVGNSNSEVNTVVGENKATVSKPCELAVLRAEAQKLFTESIGEIPDSWVLEVSVGSTTSRELYGWVEGEPINPCEYALEYSMPLDTEEEKAQREKVETGIRDALFGDSWSTQAQNEVILSGNSEPVVVSLGNAGGPMMNTEVFMSPMEFAGVAQFAKIESAQRWENRKDYMEGLRDDPCPCMGSIRLSVTAPVKLEEFMPQ